MFSDYRKIKFKINNKKITNIYEYLENNTFGYLIGQRNKKGKLENKITTKYIKIYMKYLSGGSREVYKVSCGKGE